jgi:hypothetical protein
VEPLKVEYSMVQLFDSLKVLFAPIPSSIFSFVKSNTSMRATFGRKLNLNGAGSGRRLVSTASDSMHKRIHIRMLVAAMIGLTVIAAAEPGLPTSVTHTREGEKHFYSVANIFAGATFKIPSETGSYYTGKFPDSLDASIDLKQRKFTVSTSRPLSVQELQKAFDEAAWEGGDLPYWTELQLRDTPKSPRFAASLFRVKPLKREHPKGLAWFGVSKLDMLRLPIMLAYNHKGTLLVSHTTAHCMAHDRFAIRILDAEGRVLWQDQEVALASCGFALVDQDGDGIHEILLDRDDHGTRSRFVITNTSEHGLQADPVVTPDALDPPYAPSAPTSPRDGADR